MASSTFPSSQIGLPYALKYDLPPSLSDSARSYSVNVAPDGITSVAGPTPTTTAFVTNSTGAFGNYSSQIVSFTIPSGMSDSVFLDTNSTTLSFTLTYTVSTASAGATGGSINMIGSGASWFDSLVLYSNNTPVETVNQYGLLQNYLLQNTVNQAERFGGISIAMGADTNSANGIELAHSATGTYRYNFCVPLLSVIGVNSDKFFPIGSVNNLQLQMTTANITPIVSYCTAITTQPVFTAFTLSEFTLNMKYIDVGDLAAQMLRQTLQEGKWYMKSTTYTNSSVTLPSGSNGAQQLLLQIRNSSVKSILHQFGISQAAACPNGYYDAINPALTSRQCQVGGQFYPNKPINDCARPAEGYSYLIQALGGAIPKALGTVVTRDMYNAVLPSVPSGSDTFCVVPSAGLRPLAQDTDAGAAGSAYYNRQISKFPNSAYYGYDLEKSSGILFQGVNTRASPPFLNLYLGTASSSSIICQSWGMSDVVLVIDTIAKQVQAFI
jgi:hypothetical protein